MINRGAILISRLAVFCAVLFTFTACGGGGGGGGDAFYPSNDSQLELTLYDQDGNDTKTITTSTTGKITARIKNNGSNIVVSATTTIGTLATATALTDGSGVATFQIDTGPEKGAGTFTATATTKDGTLTETLGFSVGDNGLRLGYFNGDTFLENQIGIQPGGTLATGGNAQLSVAILNSAGERVTSVQDVRFSSGCISGGQSTINPINPVKSSNGLASTTYTAGTCSGTDQITASVVGATNSASGTIEIASPTANAVNFVSAVPELIVLRGTGGGDRDETSDVTFKVVDGTGKPLQGILVNFSLSTEVGGLSLSKTSSLSDGQGQVTVTVSSGNVATTVRVIATVDSGNGQTVATASDLLTVTTGLPDQNSISLSVGDTFIVANGMTTDNLTRTLTVSMADKFNNPVVNGTGAVFTTEYGAIVGACNTTDGTCSVEWRSQEPRYPTLTGSTYVVSTDNQAGLTCSNGGTLIHSGPAIPCPADLGNTRGGRSTILVTAIGEESFVDRNGNGIFDQDEADADLFENLPEAFIDNNEDGYYTPALPECVANPTGSIQCISGQEETFVDFNNNGVYDLNDDPAEYNGLLCPPEGNGVWCSRDLVNVRSQNLVILSNPGGAGFITILVNGTAITTTRVISNTSYKAYISDHFNSMPPAESTITVATDGDCELVSPASFTVPNSAARGAYTIDVKATDANPLEDGTLTITVEPTDGPSQAKTYQCGKYVDCTQVPTPSECPAP